MTQAMPLADLSQVHLEAMRVNPEDAMKLWALITLDPAAWKEINNYRATLRVRGFQRQIGATWQFDSQQYPMDTADRKGPLRPGERIWVPLIVAQFGVKNTAVWEYETSIEGEVINKQDFLYGQQLPVIRILEIRNPGDFGTQMQEQIKVALAPCSLCGEDFRPEELASHIVAVHGDQLAAAAAPKVATGAAVNKQIAGWADKQAKAREAREVRKAAGKADVTIAGDAEAETIPEG